MPIAAVFFDVGETLIDETTVWNRWADWLEVPRFTFFAAMGAVLQRATRRPLLQEVVQLLGLDVDLRRAREELGGPELGFTVDDLYPDALPCLETLRQRGYRIGIAGNQPTRADAVLRHSGLPFDWLLISDVVGVSKPDPAFFELLRRESGLPADSILYVGDRIDNDVIPAAAAGMPAAHIRRGPWGVIQADWPGVEQATLRVSSLRELPDRLSELDGAV